MSRAATITLRLLVLAAACALWQVWASAHARGMIFMKS